MGKQTVVLKLYMEDTKKKSKALKTAVSLPGVISAALEGQEKIVVVGEGIDSVKLTMILRKKMGSSVDLISVASVDEKKEKKEDKSAAAANDGVNKNIQPFVWPYDYIAAAPPPPYYNQARVDNDPCRVM